MSKGGKRVFFSTCHESRDYSPFSSTLPNGLDGKCSHILKERVVFKFIHAIHESSEKKNVYNWSLKFNFSSSRVKNYHW